MSDFILLGFAFFLGFIHTFEADHLAAVTNLVTRNTGYNNSAKDGFYWGIGHTLMIWIIGLFMLALKYNIDENYFTKMEGVVGLMLILLGTYRLINSQKTHHHNIKSSSTLALGVGLIHGLAGSGAVVATAVTDTSSVYIGLSYLMIFGIGSILGMFSVSAFLSWFLERVNLSMHKLVHLFTWLTALFCIGYGIIVIKNSWHIL